MSRARISKLLCQLCLTKSAPDTNIIHTNRLKAPCGNATIPDAQRSAPAHGAA
jgi:hypothetical protein